MPFNMTIRWPIQPESVGPRTVWPSPARAANRHTHAMSLLRTCGDTSGRLTGSRLSCRTHASAQGSEELGPFRRRARAAGLPARRHPAAPVEGGGVSERAVDLEGTQADVCRTDGTRTQP